MFVGLGSYTALYNVRSFDTVIFLNTNSLDVKDRTSTLHNISIGSMETYSRPLFFVLMENLFKAFSNIERLGENTKHRNYGTRFGR